MVLRKRKDESQKKKNHINVLGQLDAKMHTNNYMHINLYAYILKLLILYEIFPLQKRQNQ